MLRFLIPCQFLNLFNQSVEALKLSWSGDSPFSCSCKEKCFAFSWRSGPEIGVPVDLCWINQVCKAWSNRSSFASFSDFRFNPSLVSMLSVNFRILSLFLRISEICCLLMPNSRAKFVPFSPLSKREIIICLSLIERTTRFRFVDMLSFESWPLRAFTWPTLTELIKHDSAHICGWLLLKCSAIGIGFNGAETNCGIAHILGILLMNSCNTDIFFSNYYHLQSVRFEFT